MPGNATKFFRFVAFAALFASFAAACADEPGRRGKNDSGPVRIGLSMDTLKEERWQRDRDLFMASLDNGMSLKNIPDFTQDIVKGCILVAAVGLDMIWRRKSG